MLIICAGNIRSGSTLQYNLTRNIVAYNGGYSLHPAEVRSGFWDVARRYVNDERVIVVKNHFLPPAEVVNPYTTSSREVRVLMCHRDLRDVCVSLMRFQDITFKQAMPTIKRMIGDMKNYIDATDGEHLMMSYSELTQNMVASTEKIIEFIDNGWMSTPPIEDINKLSADNVLKLQEKMSQDDRIRTHIAPNHVWNGLNGKWRRILTGPQQIEINDVVKEWLEEYGYEITEQSKGDSAFYPLW